MQLSNFIKCHPDHHILCHLLCGWNHFRGVLPTFHWSSHQERMVLATISFWWLSCGRLAVVKDCCWEGCFNQCLHFSHFMYGRASILSRHLIYIQAVHDLSRAYVRSRNSRKVDKMTNKQCRDLGPLQKHIQRPAGLRIFQELWTSLTKSCHSKYP